MWYIILILLTVIYGLISIYIPTAISGFLGVYIIQPLLWIILAIIVFLIARREGLNIWSFKKIRKWEIGKTPFQGAILIGGFHVSLLVIIGLLIGFGNSPYSHTPLYLLINTLYLGSALIAIELSRSYLIKKGTSNKKYLNLTIILIAILFLIISIPFAQYTSLDASNPAGIAKFIGEYLIPGLVMGLFASYLAYLGGALPAIGYMGIVQGFTWYSPYLPAGDWAVVALIKTFAPAIGFLLIQSSIQLSISNKKIKRKKFKDPALPWLGVAFVCTLLIFFSFGYFGTQPSVIYSGSMRPNLEIGDVVFVSDINLEEIKVGDIIQFKTENMILPIVHRVYEINEEDGNLFFITKGDDNDNPDIDPVIPQNIIGKVTFTIPKIGWISIGIKEMLKNIGIKI